MADLGWKADGIERAEACGGVTLEKYRRPGFAAGIGVRKRPGDAQVSGFGIEDPEWWEYEEDDRRHKR